MKITKGDLCIADLSPTVGSEQTGTRPVVVVSGNALNAGTNICIVCILSSRIKEYPGSTTITPNLENGLEEPSEVMSFQIRTIDQSRIHKQVGKLSIEQIAEIERKVNEVFTF